MIIDKAKWKTYRFEDFAQNISQRVEPKSTDLDIYVGLEHLDPDCLHIKRYGSTSDVEGTKLKFYKGDVIFGKRRAYQRKTALAEYDGICSAHAMVLRAKTDVVDEKFFPFLFHSKVFQNRAVNISVGGLSPTINWKDIAKQEFLLPPKEEQTRFAELLWAADEVVEKEKEVKERLELIEKTFIKRLSLKNRKANIRLSEVIDLNYGKPLKENDRIDGIYPVVSSAGIIGYHNDFYIEAPGIVIGRKGSAGNVIWVKNNFWTIDTAYWVKIKDDKKFDVYFIYLLLKSLGLETLSITTAIPGLNRDDALNAKVFIPEKEEQKNIAKQFNVINDVIDKQNRQIELSQQLKSILINKIF
jgi:type I restriction enzyme S subunit